MIWAQKLKQVFTIDTETCHECSGTMNVIARIEDPVIIKTILTHLDENVPMTEGIRLPDCRAPPQPGFSIWAEKPDQLTHRLLLGDTRQGCAWPVCRNRYEIPVFIAQQANQKGGNG